MVHPNGRFTDNLSGADPSDDLSSVLFADILPCRALPAQQAIAHVMGIEAERFTDVFEREQIRTVGIRNPLFRFAMQRLLTLALGPNMLLKTDHGILQHREHEHPFRIEMKAPLMAGLELRLDENIGLEDH